MAWILQTYNTSANQRDVMHLVGAPLTPQRQSEAGDDSTKTTTNSELREGAVLEKAPSDNAEASASSRQSLRRNRKPPASFNPSVDGANDRTRQKRRSERQ